MSVYKRGPAYSYDFVLNGQRYTGNTRALTRSRAQAFVVDMKRDLEAAHKGVGLKEVTVEEALRLQVASNTKADTSITTYETRIKRLTGEIDGHWGFAKTKTMGSLSTADIITLVTKRLAEGMAPSTVGVELGQLKAAHNLIKSMGYKVDQTIKFKRPKVVKKTRHLSADEEAALLAAMHPEARIKRLPWQTLEATPRHVRRGLWDLYDLTVFLLDTGVRHNEAVRARWSDVAQDLGRIAVRRWKTGSEDKVYTTARLRAVLTRRQETRSAAELFIFPSGDDPKEPRAYRVEAISRTMTELGFNSADNLERFGSATVHTLRHTFASKLLQTGKYDLARLKDRLGHSTIRTTEQYAHLLPDSGAEEAALLLDEMEAASGR